MTNTVAPLDFTTTPGSVRATVKYDAATIELRSVHGTLVLPGTAVSIDLAGTIPWMVVDSEHTWEIVSDDGRGTLVIEAEL